MQEAAGDEVGDGGGGGGKDKGEMDAQLDESAQVGRDNGHGRAVDGKGDGQPKGEVDAREQTVDRAVAIVHERRKRIAPRGMLLARDQHKDTAGKRERATYGKKARGERKVLCQ